MRLFYGLRYSLLCKLIIEMGRLIMCLMSVMSITDCFNDRLWWCISTETKRVRINAGDLIDAYRRYHGQVQTFLLLLLRFYTFLVDQPIDPFLKIMKTSDGQVKSSSSLMPAPSPSVPLSLLPLRQNICFFHSPMI